jgi:hypothetical protein
MTPKNSGLEILIDNEALRAFDIRLPGDIPGPISRPISNAMFIAIEDGTGIFMVEGKDAPPRFIPIARGRVEWLGTGRIEVRQGHGAFGRALLVEIRNLPHPAGIERAFGDRMLLAMERICVYEEVIGPSQARLMHNHGPRLVVCLSSLNTRNTLPDGEKLEIKREAGAVTWIPKVVTHEVVNIGAEPFWCVVVEHP